MPPAAQLYTENLALQAQLGEAHAELAVLRAQLAWLKQKLFGPGQGERLDRAQLLLQIEGLEKLLQARGAPRQTIRYERTAPQRGSRPPAAATFAHLPVGETIEIVPEAVRVEPDAFERIGEERTFEVDIVPPKLFRREIVRPEVSAQGGSHARAAAGARAGTRGARWLCLGRTGGLGRRGQVRRP